MVISETSIFNKLPALRDFLLAMSSGDVCEKAPNSALAAELREVAESFSC